MTDRARKRAGIYLRISDDREGQELGVTRQEEDLRAAAEHAGDAIVDVYVDNDISASTKSTKPRPDYNRILADARAGRIEKIWAYTSSRLTRRPMEHEGQIQLAEQHGTEYAYIRSPSFDLNTANGRMIARILAAKDANESEETSERIVRTFTQKRERGEYLGGGRSFGWLIDGETPEPREHEALREASDDVVLGVSSYEIMTAWHTEGLLSARGNRWTTANLRRLLLRPRNAGFIVHGGEIVGRYPWAERAPVPEETWLAVCAILGDPTRTTSPGTKPRWLGSGLYACWGCETANMRVGWSKISNQRVYRCERKHPTLDDRRHVTRQQPALDAYVEELCVTRLSHKDAVDLARDERPSVDVKALRVERASARSTLDQLDDDLDAGRIDRERWLRRNSRARARLEEIEKALAPTLSSNPFVGVVDADDPAAVWYGTLPDRSDGLGLEHRRRILAALLSVTILPVTRKNKGFDPDRVGVERLL